MIECADALLSLGDRIGPLHAVVAHSFGAPTSARALERGLIAGRLVMAAPPRSVHRSLRETAMGLGLPEAVFERAARALEERMAFTWSELETDRIVAALGLPLLVVHDQGDRVVPWEDGAAVARASPGSTLVSTSGLGHRAILVDSEIVDRIVRFAAGCGDPVGGAGMPLPPAPPPPTLPKAPGG